MSNRVFLIISSIFMFIMLSCREPPPETADLKNEPVLAENSVILEEPTLNIQDVTVLKYIAGIMNTNQTLRSNGGFFNPITNNPQNIKMGLTIPTNDSVDDGQLVGEDVEYLLKIVVQGIPGKLKTSTFTYKDPHAGQYTVREIIEENEKLPIWRQIYGLDRSNKNDIAEDVVEKEAAAAVAGKTFHVHSYHSYKKDVDSPVINGWLNSVKDDDQKIVSVRGTLMLQLWDEVHKFPVVVEFGKDNEAFVLTGNDIAVRGKLILIQYQDLAKGTSTQLRDGQEPERIRKTGKKIAKEVVRTEYDLATLSDQDKENLKELNLFNINENYKNI